MADTCKNCANRVYDERQGVHICKIYKHRVKDVDKYMDCEMHENKHVKGKKRDERQA